MATRYAYATTLEYSTGDAPEVDEVEVEVSYTVAWGSPESGAGYLADPYKYDPGSPDEVEDLTLRSIDGVGGPFDQETEAAILQQIAINHTEAMLQEARDREAAWAE
jgi:hypothetical protein